MIATLGAGGAERVLLTLLEQLADGGADVTLFLFRREGGLLSDVPSGVTVRAVLAPGQSIKVNAAKIFARLLTECSQNDVVIGALEGWPTFLAYAAARLLGKPCLGWVHADLAATPLYSDIAPVAAITRFVYPKLDGVAFVSSRAMNATRELIGRSGRNWRVIYNGVRSPVPIARTTKSGVMRVTAVGRLAPEKGFDILLEAHARLLESGIPHHLTIVGEGPERATLEKLVRLLGISSSVALPGYSSDVYAWLRESDVFVVASRREGFSLALLEAMTQGVPVVSTDCAGPSELLGDGRWGLLVPGEANAATLAQGLRTLLLDQAKRAHFARAGLERAQMFSVERLAHEWRTLLADVSGEPRSGTW